MHLSPYLYARTTTKPLEQEQRSKQRLVPPVSIAATWFFWSTISARSLRTFVDPVLPSNIHRTETQPHTPHIRCSLPKTHNFGAKQTNYSKESTGCINRWVARCRCPCTNRGRAASTTGVLRGTASCRAVPGQTHARGLSLWSWAARLARRLARDAQLAGTAVDAT